jgi:hypothetical protein
MQVYRIFNSVDGKSYIGITKWTFDERYPFGKWWKWTHSKHLKLAIKKYGLESFSHEILWQGETSSESEMIELEKTYIRQYNSFVPDGYNLTKGGSKNGPSTNVKEYELVDRNGTLYKIKNLRKFCMDSGLNYAAMLNLVSGLSKSSLGFSLVGNHENIRLTKSFELENILTRETATVASGEIHLWSKKRNLSPKGMEKLLRKELKLSQGWKLKNTPLESLSQRIGDFTFYHLDGREETVRKLSDFFNKHGLDKGSVYDLVDGKALEVCGWRTVKDTSVLKTQKEKRLGRLIKLISPQNEVFEIKNISAFCRDNNLNRNSFEALVRGRIKTHKGWKKYE